MDKLKAISSLNFCKVAGINIGIRIQEFVLFDFVCFHSLHPSQHFFQSCRNGSSWVEPVLSGE